MVRTFENFLIAKARLLQEMDQDPLAAIKARLEKSKAERAARAQQGQSASATPAQPPTFGGQQPVPVQQTPAPAATPTTPQPLYDPSEIQGLSSAKYLGHQAPQGFEHDRGAAGKSYETTPSGPISATDLKALTTDAQSRRVPVSEHPDVIHFSTLSNVGPAMSADKKYVWYPSGRITYNQHYRGRR